MPRLLRVHFASIGHPHARLAPLTLDLRGRGGDASDTVLWLRNAGGKSSILNLFFSLFRPAKAEFLGARAEGRARRIEDYVKADDLAFVLTEWLFPPEAGADDQAPRHRVFGQTLSWRGGQVSSDGSNLRRLFFALDATPDAPFDALPIEGLSLVPVESFDRFRHWLQTVAAQRPELGVVITQNQRAWVDHLDGSGIDPELFRYQLQMNLREGAADERFRFATPDEFVRFFLELALDTAHADQVAENLQGLQGELRRRPELLLEQRFIEAVQAELGPLVTELRAHEGAAGDLADARGQAIALSRGLEASIADLEARAAAADATVTEADSERLQAENRLRSVDRWANGLERRASLLDVEEAEAELEGNKQDREALRTRLKAAQAGQALVAQQALEGRRNALVDALQRADTALRPRVEALETLGAELAALLDAEYAAVTRTRAQVEADLKETRLVRKEAGERTAEIRRDLGGIDERLKGVRDRIAQRDRAREALRSVQALEPREDGGQALVRWMSGVERIAGRRAEVRRTIEAARERLGALDEQRRELDTERTRQDERARQLGARYDQALVWRGRLQEDPLLVDVGETGLAPAPEQAGLGRRLRTRAEQAQRRLLQLAVDGAEDVRAVDGLDKDGLLPPSRDVERVVAALTQRGVDARAATAWLADHVPADERQAHLVAAPARFSGVIVPDARALQVAHDLGTVAGLSRPVAVSVSGAPLPAGDGAIAVVCPASAGSWDHVAASEAREALLGRIEGRRADERAVRDERAACEALAAEVERYFATWGEGRLEGLAQERDGAAQRAAIAVRELERLAAEKVDVKATLAGAETEERELERDLQHAERVVTRLKAFCDDHERLVPELRAVEEEARKLRESREAELVVLEGRLEVAAHREEEQRSQVSELTRSLDALAAERAGIDMCGPLPEEPTVGIAEARERWALDRRAYEQHVSSSRLQGELDQLEDRLKDARAAYRRAVRGLDEAFVQRLVDEHGAALPDEEARIDRQLRDVVEAVGQLTERVRQRRERLQQLVRQRAADDLPPDEAPPATAAEARERAAVWYARTREAAARVEEAVVTRDRLALEGEHLRRSARTREQRRELLLEVLGEAPLETVAPMPLPADDASVAELVRHAAERLRKVRGLEGTAKERVASQAERVRRVAYSEGFAEHRSQLRERLKGDVAEVILGAPAWHEALESRASVIAQALAQIERHRALILDGMDAVARDAARLLARAPRASTLPGGLGPWGGRAFLQVGFRTPEQYDERAALLSPLIDAMVAEARVPKGLELAQKSVLALAPQGFRVTILKPDAVLRTERVGITEMTSFSRGQQLTSAILLYCTLAKLRAQTRGRGGADAGVLVLDNPIGTCSSVPLLELQRSVAREMGVQLVFTTGVHDLEALSTLPNRIRLVNDQRDQVSGDTHVTATEDGSVRAAAEPVEYRVTGMRVFRKAEAPSPWG
ncbi:MAG: hypothetical protein KC635_23200, partial [Myxococcales bacterium]|nr:hypothetical protein [Myxococcales bacterium]